MVAYKFPRKQFHYFVRSARWANFAAKSTHIKTGVTIFLILLLNCQVFNKFLVMATFFANEDYIAANLCVNKDHPEMHCNGHCQLDKKLHDDQDHNQPNSDKKVSFESVVFYFNTENPIPGIATFTSATPQNGIPVLFSEQTYYARPLHPPAFA